MTEGLKHLQVAEDERALVVEFADRKILEELSIVEIGEELSRVAEENTGKPIILSFRNVDHLSSAALGMLIRLREQVVKSGGRLILTDIRPQIFEVFKITKLNRLFEIYDTQTEAFEKLARQS